MALSVDRCSGHRYVRDARIDVILRVTMELHVAPIHVHEAPVDHWFVKKEELVLGPYSVDELRRYVARGKVTGFDLVSRDGETGWTAIHQVPQFRDGAAPLAAVAQRTDTTQSAPPRTWYVARGSQVVGPLDLSSLRAAVAQGQLRLDDQACEAGASAWCPVVEVDALADILPVAPTAATDTPATVGASPADASHAGLIASQEANTVLSGDHLGRENHQNVILPTTRSSGESQTKLRKRFGLTFWWVAIMTVGGSLLVGLIVIAKASYQFMPQRSEISTVQARPVSRPVTSPTTTALPNVTKTRCGGTRLFAGPLSTCAILDDRSLSCWGKAPDEGLATPVERCESAPFPPLACHRSPSMIAGLRNVAEVALGVGFACARLTDGTVQCWGANRSGTMGDGSLVEQRTMPQPVPGLINVTQIAAGYLHVCARLADGSVRCWGNNINGQLGAPSRDNCGDGTLPYPTPCSRTPIEIPGLRGVTQLALGAVHSCARLVGGNVQCWGSNHAQQLGGLAADVCVGPAGRMPGEACARSPVTVQGVTDTAVLRVGGALTVVSTTGGAFFGWGEDAVHLFGDGSTALHQWVPDSISGEARVVQLVIGNTSDHSCVLFDDGRVRCWGSNDRGQLGIGADVTSVQTPTIVQGLDNVAELALGGNHTCARSCDGTIRCWGDNMMGEVGDGTTEQRATPTMIDLHLAPFSASSPSL